MNLAPVSLKKFWIMLGVLLVILIGLAWMSKALLKEVVGDVIALSKLSGGYVVQGSGTGSRVSSIGWFGNHPITTKSGTMLDYAPVSGNSYALVLSPDGRDEYLIQLGSPDQKLDSQGGIKSSLAVSPDATYVAYAQLSPIIGFTRVGPSANVKDWSMDVYDTKGKFATVYPSAYAPQFFTKNNKSYLEYMAAGGTGFVDLTAKERYVSTTTASSTDTERPTFVTSDGAHLLAYNVKKGDYSLYTLTGSFPFLLKLVTPLPSAYSQIVGVDTEGFYVAAYNIKSNASTVTYVLFQHPTVPQWAYTIRGPQVSTLIP